MGGYLYESLDPKMYQAYCNTNPNESGWLLLDTGIDRVIDNQNQGAKPMNDRPRERLLRIAAVLFTLLAVSNLLKPFQLWGENTGFVWLGQRLSGTANTIAGPVFGFYLLVYALGIWRQKFYALPMAYAYAVYVIVNLALFISSRAASSGEGNVLFGLGYALVGIGVSSGTALLLTKHRAILT